MRVFARLCHREWLLLMRQSSDWLNPLLFFCLLSILFPMATDVDPARLQQIGPGVVWVSALLANLLLMMRVFNDDFHRGTLLHYSIGSGGLLAYVWAKVVLRWLFYALPLLLLSPVLALMYHLCGVQLQLMVVGLLLATPAVVWLTALLSSMTLSARQGGVLLGVILFPMLIPVVVFAAGSIEQAGHSALMPLCVLAAMSLFTLAVAPALTAWLLRQQLHYQ